MRRRSHRQANAFRERQQSSVYQRLAHHLIDLEESRRRTCRSSRPARSPIFAFARQAIELARFVHARPGTVGGISKALPPSTPRSTPRKRRASKSSIFFVIKSTRSPPPTWSQAKKKKSRTAINWPA